MRQCWGQGKIRVAVGFSSGLELGSRSLPPQLSVVELQGNSLICPYVPAAIQAYHPGSTWNQTHNRRTLVALLLCQSICPYSRN